MKLGGSPGHHTGAVPGHSGLTQPSRGEGRALAAPLQLPSSSLPGPGRGVRKEQSSDTQMHETDKGLDKDACRSQAPHGTGPGGSARLGLLCSQGEYPWMHSVLL